MKKLILITLIIALCSCAFAGLFEENQFLEAELNLAKKPNIYFVFDLEKKMVEIKVRGTTLREFPIEGVRLWGSPPVVSYSKLIKKTALLKPKRKEIKPKKEKDSDEEQDTFQIEALELKDMPSSYKLLFDNGMRLLVSPKPEGFFGWIAHALRTTLWYVVRPLESAINMLLKRPFYALRIEVSKDDARRIYWAFPEGNEAILYNP